MIAPRRAIIPPTMILRFGGIATNIPKIIPKIATFLFIDPLSKNQAEAKAVTTNAPVLK